MTRLAGRIARQIEAAGPISVADYMALCLFDPEDGYYTTREPFGVDGDFTTAPEISQMFGELVAVWLHEAWTALGRPSSPVIAEIGPGRGTLMKDMARTLSRLASSLVRQARWALVEASPRLAAVQRETLQAGPAVFTWHETVATLPSGPLLIVGNELFDAVPIRQYVKFAQGWRERVVTLDDEGRLVLRAGAGGIDPSYLPPGAAEAPAGTIAEIAPARAALMEEIAARIAHERGAGLFIDYGYLRPALGDTLQALRQHEYDDVLAHPGEADLTAHVDFHALAAATRKYGLGAAFLTQGEFLLGMGLLERAGSLGGNAALAVRERLSGEVERLAGPDSMGNLFKAMAVLPEGVAVHPFPPAH